MQVKSIFSWTLLLCIGAIMAVGRLYDERIEIFDINVSIFLSVPYIILVVLMINSIKKLYLSKTSFFLLLFFLIIVLYTPLLWTIYGYSSYGLLKYINFILIVIPVSIIVMHKFSYSEVINLLIIFFALSCVLAFLGLFVLSDTYGSLSILGGGPIIFARWMIFAIILLLFLPKLKEYKLRIIPIILLFILALSAGSRGPIIAFLICVLIFLLLNFSKVFYKGVLFSLFLVLIFTFTSIDKKVMHIGSVNRIFMNISTHGLVKKATGARFDFINISNSLIKEHPLGVGCGNWRTQANIINKHQMWSVIRLPLGSTQSVF